MKFKFLLVLAIVSAVFCSQARAQTDESNKPKIISGGVINGKAVNLVKPAYPKEAKDARADGAVLIQVLIDEQGNVIEAEAVSGHPLLRQVTVQAARASKFSPTALGSQPVRVKGVIVYNFVLPMPFMQIGFELALAQKNPTPVEFPLASLSGTLPRSWTEELADLKKLESFRVEKPSEKEDTEKEAPKTEKKEAPEKPDAKFNVGSNEKVNQGVVLKAPPLRMSKISVSGPDFTLDNKIPEAVETLKSVQTRLNARLSPNQRVSWYFRTGRILGSIKAEIDDSAKRQENFAALAQLLEQIPFGVSEPAIRQIKNVAEFSQKTDFDVKTKENLLARLEELRYLRVE